VHPIGVAPAVLIGLDLDPARELRRIRSVDLVDLPSGRWPQIERGEPLARLLLDVLPAPAVPPATAAAASPA